MFKISVSKSIYSENSIACDGYVLLSVNFAKKSFSMLKGLYVTYSELMFFELTRRDGYLPHTQGSATYTDS